MLNNFDFVRSGAHTSAGGRGSTGDVTVHGVEWAIRNESGLENPSPLYNRHDAELFTWSLICLYSRDEEGKDFSRSPSISSATVVWRLGNIPCCYNCASILNDVTKISVESP